MRKAITVNPIRHYSNTVEYMTNESVVELNKYLSEGWNIESETILPSSTSVSNHTVGYKGLASVIYVLYRAE